MKKRLTLLVLASVMLLPGPLPVFPQAYVDPSALPRTYNAGFSVVCAGAGDCVTFSLASGGAKTTSIREIWISQPSGNITVSIIRRSALDTGGTGSSQTLVKSDTNDASPNTVVTAYTVVPTPGTTAGTIFTLPLTTTSTLIRDSSVTNYKPILLQGTTQCIAINVSGTATITVDVVVTENP